MKGEAAKGRSREVGKPEGPKEPSGDPVYLAAPLFTQWERQWNRAFAQALSASARHISVILPQDFRIEGKYNNPKHFRDIFARCCAAIARSRAVVAVLEGADVDSGVSFEVGMARALGVPVVGVRTDYRDNQDHGVNLMLAGACDCLVREYSFREDLSQLARSVARRLDRLLAKREGK